MDEELFADDNTDDVSDAPQKLNFLIVGSESSDDLSDSDESAEEGSGKDSSSTSASASKLSGNQGSTTSSSSSGSDPSKSSDVSADHSSSGEGDFDDPGESKFDPRNQWKMRERWKEQIKRAFSLDVLPVDDHNQAVHINPSNPHARELQTVQGVWMNRNLARQGLREYQDRQDKTSPGYLEAKRDADQRQRDLVDTLNLSFSRYNQEQSALRLARRWQLYEHRHWAFGALGWLTFGGAGAMLYLLIRNSAGDLLPPTTEIVGNTTVSTQSPEAQTGVAIGMALCLILMAILGAFACSRFIDLWRENDKRKAKMSPLPI